MKGRNLSLIAGAALAVGAVWAPCEASAQTVPPAVPRDSTLETVSTISMIVGVGTVSLMPRVYYSDPEATVGWKARWHISVLAPALTLTAATLLIEFPIKNAIKSTRPNCSLDQTLPGFPNSGCESFGGPSTHSFAAWSAMGSGLGIWVADTFIHSDGRVHPGSIIGNIVIPVAAGIATSVTRGIGGDTTKPFENGGQIGAGVGVGIPVGFLIGLGYGLLAKPNCGYGDKIFCW